MLLDYEDDALYAKKQGEPVQVVTPPQTILIQNPIAVTKTASPAAKAFLAYLLSPAGQTVWGQQGYRPVLPVGGGEVRLPQAQDPLHDRQPRRLDGGEHEVLRSPDGHRGQRRAVARRVHRQQLAGRGQWVQRVADLGLPGGQPSAPADRGPGRSLWRRRPPAAPPAALAAAGRVTAALGGPALAVTYLSLLVLLPLAALLTNAFSGGWSAFWAAITQPEAVAALELTLATSAIVAVVNSVAGLAIAFVLVRDDFRGKAC